LVLKSNEGSNMKSTLLAAALCVATVCSVSAHAQTDTTFTYQGQLNESGAPANGSYSMRFKLFDALAGGNQIGSTFIINPKVVADGLFAAELDFGAQDFSTGQHWLEIIVYGDTLAPRQAVTGSPYSIQTRGINIDDDGNVAFNSMEAIEGLFTLSSIGGIDVVIDADTNNVGEDQNARIIMRQDGGVANSRMGYREATNILEIMQEYNDNLVLGTNNTDHLTINTAGNVGIGEYPNFNMTLLAAGDVWRGVEGRTSSTFENSAGVKGLASASSGLTYGVYGENRSTSGAGVYGENTLSGGSTIGVLGRVMGTSGRAVLGEATSTTGNTTGVVGLCFSDGGKGVQGSSLPSTGTGKGVVGWAGSSNGYDFYAAGAGINYGSSSSIRWKSNVVNVSNPLDKLAQLRGVYYDWDEEHGGQHAIGMIAEEVGKVLPEIVGYEENGVDAIGMDYSMLTPLLVEATNALRAEKDAQIKKLEVENQLLKARLDRLERMMVLIADQ